MQIDSGAKSRSPPTYVPFSTHKVDPNARTKYVDDEKNVFYEPKEDDYDTRIQKQIIRHMIAEGKSKTSVRVDTWPQDESEFGLILTLFRKYPPWGKRKHELSKYNAYWRELVRTSNWDQLATLYDEIQKNKDMMILDETKQEGDAHQDKDEIEDKDRDDTDNDIDWSWGEETDAEHNTGESIDWSNPPKKKINAKEEYDKSKQAFQKTLTSVYKNASR